jgi:hypothetical protein
MIARCPKCEQDRGSRRWWPRATGLLLCGAFGAIVGYLIGGFTGGVVGTAAGFVAASIPAMGEEYQRGVRSSWESIARRRRERAQSATRRREGGK